jgi:hypothetical protein
MSEREILQQEVAAHAERVAEITAALQEAGEGGDLSDAHARLLRMELIGRAAAIEIGSSRLRFLRD